ncbi:hypothetical protein [Adlercreutzia mucosicola]|uniref:hypothetical protein n=1 Tax=Adlercreutzia mucosicola TaxID=580026 RepID=UPI0004189179|nr:hypothetical protein [Adlercreutzia mucosicola]
MSGPKTSQLEIERMIAAQLEALRSDVDDATARARRRVEELRRQVEALARSCPEATEAAASVRALAATALARLAGECAFTPATVMADSVALSARCCTRATAIADAFCAEAAPAEERILRARSRAAAAADAQDFASLLRAAALGAEEAIKRGGAQSDAGAAFSANGGTTAAHATGETGAAKAANTGTTPPDIQEIARRAWELAQSPYTLAADRAVLMEHGRRLEPATAAQLALLLPAMEANEGAMAELASLIATLEQRAEPDTALVHREAPRTFATLEEAAARVEQLRARQAEADRNAYLQACIDEVMARHGYDIVRSVSLGRELTGTHHLFGSAENTAGIHSFLSEEGDLMLQIAGLPEGAAGVADGEAVCLEAVDSPARADELLRAQEAFCAVYDEIADELAAYGITNKLRYRAAADTAFSREMRAAARAEQAAATASVQTAATHDTARGTRRRRKRAATREMS